MTLTKREENRNKKNKLYIALTGKLAWEKTTDLPQN
jgi:hypothetical protein